MIIATQKKDVRHPEGMILLKSGKTLECFPKADRPAVICRDEVTLDTTGEFLQVEGGPKKVPRASTREPWVELFFREAFFLFEHREQVCFPSPFSEIWSSFVRINRRYTEAKQTYQSYTLEETLSKLREA